MSRARQRRIWPVRELVAQVRELVEQEYGDVWVEGEISNYRPAPSGHVYFTLKDADAQLPIVLFRRQAMLLRFRPEDGLHVLVRGRVSVYEQRGQMQLVAETMEPVGAGSLQLAFEQLKERLKAEGLFDAERKRPLPMFPRTVGIVTSPTGAVIRDFLNIVSRRHSGLNVLLCPVSVQGESAPAEIEAALAELNAAGLVDLIVLARGGGSLEDLAAFNSERVARAIASAGLPVVSAVGHETDFTIADFVADLRAPTPSAAAELITEAQHKIAEHLAAQSTAWSAPHAFSSCRRASGLTICDQPRRVARLCIAPSAWRSGSMTHRSAWIQPSRIARQRQNRMAELAAAVLHHDPRHNWPMLASISPTFAARLQRSLERLVESSAARARRPRCAPALALAVGCARPRLCAGSFGQGALIRSATQIASGDKVTTRLADGTFTSRVESISSSALHAPTPEKRSKKSADHDHQCTANCSEPTEFDPLRARLRLTQQRFTASGWHSVTRCEGSVASQGSSRPRYARVRSMDCCHSRRGSAPGRRAGRKRGRGDHPGGCVSRAHTRLSRRRCHLRLAQSLAGQRHQALRRRRLQAPDAVELAMEEEILYHAAQSRISDPQRFAPVEDNPLSRVTTSNSSSTAFPGSRSPV